jgi:hypothetical protein
MKGIWARVKIVNSAVGGGLAYLTHIFACEDRNLKNLNSQRGPWERPDVGLGMARKVT